LIESAHQPSYRTIAPPVPAPYLAGVGELPADVLQRTRMSSRRPLTKAQRRQADRHVRQLARDIFVARTAWERSQGVKIESEPTLAP
jgi:hypothetical protein